MGGDLYYSIHAFYYSKAVSGRVVVIKDRYDYKEKEDYDNLVDFGVDLMYKAQEAGIIVPYISVIKFDYTKNDKIHPQENVMVYESAKYVERIAVLGYGEHKDYLVTFESSGKKVVQTFGEQDTFIYLYDAQGKQIFRDDVSGYEENALFTSYLYAELYFQFKYNDLVF